MIKTFKVPLLFVVCTLLYSCSVTETLVTPKVAYQSVRNVDYKKEIPKDAKIATFYTLTEKGELVVAVSNLTSEIMIIDQTMSFFVNSDYQSTSYYDPTVRAKSETDMMSSTKGASVNLGVLGGVLGIGGGIGTLLSGINVGGSVTTGTAITNTSYFSDQPKISLAPKSTGFLSKQFLIKGVGKTYLTTQSSNIFCNSEKEAVIKFNVCISYSVDGGETFDKLITDFYVNSQVISKVTNKGNLNEALRNIYKIKPDALYEPCHLIYFVNNMPKTVQNVYDTRVNGILFDYK